jgi:hypothetical protein
MGISLYGLTPATTYDALIKTGDNEPLTSALKVLSDGVGTNLPMEASTTGVNFTGTLQQSGVAVPTAGQVAAKQDTLVSGTNIKTINGTSVLGAGNIVTPSTPPSGVAGAIQFSAGSAFNSDAANFFWDNTNKRLGLGTNAPLAPIDSYISGTGTGDFLVGKFGYQTAGNGRQVFVKIGAGGSQFDLNVEAGNPFFELRYGNSTTALGGGLAQRVRYDGVTAIPKNLVVGSGNTQTANMLQVIGSGSTSATTSLLVQNSAGTQLFKVQDDGSSSLGTSGAALISVLPSSSAIFYNGNAHYFATSSGTYFSQLNSSGFQLGNGSAEPNASAIVDLTSTTKGFLPPRMTTTQKNAIATPATGLVVYDNTTNKLCCYNGSTWNDLF